MDTITILEQWEDSGYTPDYKDLPPNLQENIAIKIFQNTPSSGNKSIQMDILNDIFTALDIMQMYNLGFITDDWVKSEYEDQLSIQESDDWDSNSEARDWYNSYNN